MEGQGAKTIPQLNQAIGDNKVLLNDLANEYLSVNDRYAANSAAVDANDKALTNLQSTFNDGYTPAVQKIQAENAKLNTDLLNQEQNLNVLNTAFAQTGVSASLTSIQANLLADSIGINLNKALTGTQVQQFIADLKQMSQETGITTSALENLAQMSGESLTTLTKGLDSATQATSKSFSSASDLLSAFGGQTAVTGQQIQLFYGQAESEATTFTANIRTAITDGYDPQLISQLLQAGPAQAGPLLQALVDGASQGMVQTVAGATSALNALNTEAIQEQKITYEAITAGTSKAGQQMASDVSNALAIQQQISVQGASATVASVNAVLNIGVSNVQRISDEYGLALPTAIQQQQVNAYLQALAQGQQAAHGLLSPLSATQAVAGQHSTALPDSIFSRELDTFNNAVSQGQHAGQGLLSPLGATQAAAASHAAALPDSIFGRITDTFNNAVTQGSSVGTGLDGAQKGVFGSAAALAGGAASNLQLGSFFGTGKAAGDSIADGLNAAAQDVRNAANAVASAANSALSSIDTAAIGAGFHPAGHAAGTPGLSTFSGLTWVGEDGPELVNFGSPVQIIPNDVATAAMESVSAPDMPWIRGASTTTNAQRSISIGDVNINGADLSDPGATKVAVMEGLVEALSGSKN
jgi:hypothetical protein